jgi:hypothetical protein
MKNSHTNSMTVEQTREPMAVLDILINFVGLKKGAVGAGITPCIASTHKIQPTETTMPTGFKPNAFRKKP